MLASPGRAKWDYDCAVIGAGPGGLVTALYLRRFRRKTILISSGKPRAAWGPKVRNLIGYHNGISGSALLRRLNIQLDKVGGLVRKDAQAKVHIISGGFQVTARSGVEIRVKKVVLATGIADNHPAVENLSELRNLGLLKYCSICDGYEMRGKPVTVLAQDDSGIQKALFIANWTRNIRILIPTKMKLAPIRVKEIRKARAKVLACDTFRLTPAPRVNGLWVKAGSRRPYLSSAVYVELGCKVNDLAFGHLRKLKRSKEGFIVTNTEQRTSVPGLFAVGDCVNLLGQISVAAGQAAVAATTIHNDLLAEP